MAVRALPAARTSSWQGAIQSQYAMRSPPVPRIPLAYTFHAQSGNADLLIRSHQRMRMRNNRTSISIVAGKLCSLIPELHLHCELPPASFTSREPPKLNDISFVRVPEASIRWAGISWWNHRVPVWDSLEPQCCLGEFSNPKTFWVRSHFRYKSMTLLGPLSQFSTTGFLTIFRPRVTILNMFMLILL